MFKGLLIGLVLGIVGTTAVGVHGQTGLWTEDAGGSGLWFQMPGGVQRFQYTDPQGNSHGGNLLPMPGLDMPVLPLTPC